MEKNEDLKQGYPSDPNKVEVGTFEWALICLKLRMSVCRKCWNGKGIYLELQIPDENSKMQLPYIYIKTVEEKLVPWVTSQTDLLANDWEIFQA